MQLGAEKYPNSQGVPAESALTGGQEWPFQTRPAALSGVCGPVDTTIRSLLQMQVLQPHPTNCQGLPLTKMPDDGFAGLQSSQREEVLAAEVAELRWT